MVPKEEEEVGRALLGKAGRSGCVHVTQTSLAYTASEESSSLPYSTLKAGTDSPSRLLPTPTAVLVRLSL